MFYALKFDDWIETLITCSNLISNLLFMVVNFRMRVCVFSYTCVNVFCCVRVQTVFAACVSLILIFADNKFVRLDFETCCWIFLCVWTFFCCVRIIPPDENIFNADKFSARALTACTQIIFWFFCECVKCLRVDC